MQSDGNSFCGSVVLVSFNMVYYSDEDSIQDQKYEKRLLWDLYYEDLKIIILLILIARGRYCLKI